MNLNIKYFGLLAEITHCSEETLEVRRTSVSDLLEVLFNKYPGLKDKDFQVAQNHTLVSRDATLVESEIALLPPFSGG
jgi:molybdopterin synthase sulfur carrier subunit